MTPQTVRDFTEMARMGEVLILAGDAREMPIERLRLALHQSSKEHLIENLLCALQLVDVERSVSQLMAWRYWPTCKRGHPQSPENVRIEGKARARRCRVCDRERKRARTADAA